MSALETLPDSASPGMRLLSIGLNPSLPSVVAGFYFANPRNRFWRALNASRLLGADVEPGAHAMQALLERERIGFTDVVKRASRGAGELRAADYRAGAPRLLDMLKALQPACAWFHGKLAYSQFLRHAPIETAEAPGWGLQETCIDATRVFVTPNPSPANAVYSLADLVDWYDRLADFLTVHAPGGLRT